MPNALKINLKEKLADVGMASPSNRSIPINALREVKEQEPESPQSEKSINLKDKSVLILEHGDSVHLAERIARDVKTSLYTPWQSRLEYEDTQKGVGLKGVDRTMDFWSQVDSADLIYCPDCHDRDATEYLRSNGYKVVGAGRGAEIELDRTVIRKISESVGLPTSGSKKIIGLKNLREYLETVNDRYVKVNTFRGSLETFHHTTAASSKSTLDRLAVKMGPTAETMVYFVDEPIPGLEGGIETFICGAELLSPMLFGYTNGKCSIFRALEYDELPEPFREVFDLILPKLAKYDMCADFHTEMRYDGKNCYLTDISARSPGSYIGGLFAEAIENFTKVLFGLGEGRAVTPKISSKFYGSVQLVADHAKENWMMIHAPKDADHWLKLTAYSKYDGDYYVSPGSNSIGGIIAGGDTVEEVISTIHERYGKLESCGMDPIASHDEFMTLIKQSEDYGIAFPTK